MRDAHKCSLKEGGIWMKTENVFLKGTQKAQTNAQ